MSARYVQRMPAHTFIFFQEALAEGTADAIRSDSQHVCVAGG